MARTGQIHHYGGMPPARANIVNTDHYTLGFELVELRQNNWQLTIYRWAPDIGETKIELFLTPEELVRIQDVLSI